MTFDTAGLLSELVAHNTRTRPFLENELRGMVAAAARGMEPNSRMLFGVLDPLGMSLGDFRAAVARVKQGATTRPAAVAAMVQSEPVNKSTEAAKYTPHAMPSAEQLATWRLELVDARLQVAQERLDALTADHQDKQCLPGSAERWEAVAAAVAELRDVEHLRAVELSRLLNL